ncbi:hypothetical protein JL721_12879 [Aureococcus anophagefferens]|nr:hypothetical protein JL721_12879 [Aureococcus anophagefferens]
MDRVKKMSFGVMVVAMVGQLAYVRFGDDLEARFPAIKSARSALAGAGAGGGEADPYALGPDGAALDPRAYRKALMKDRKALASLGREKPAWRSVVERGSTNEFQEMLRKQHRARAREDAARAKALLREPDGSATHPRLYRKLWLKDEDRMAAMRRDAPHMAATVLGDDVESFQEMLREMKRVEDGQEIYGAAGGRATIRARDAAGAERLVDVVQPRLSEEEVQSSSLPEHMACAACLGVAHQLGATIRATAAKPTDGEPLSGCLLDARARAAPAPRPRDRAARRPPRGARPTDRGRARCANATLWTDAYGLEAGPAARVLVGPGIVQANEIAAADVEIRAQHSHATGSRLVGAPRAYEPPTRPALTVSTRSSRVPRALRESGARVRRRSMRPSSSLVSRSAEFPAGACQHHAFEHDELDLLDHLNAGTELRSVVCDGVGQPCGPEAPKKKKKKKAAKAR